MSPSPVPVEKKKDGLSVSKQSPIQAPAPAPVVKWHSKGKGFEIMERILKPLVGVFDDVMQELTDSRVPDVGREEEDAFMSRAIQYIRQYILSDRVTMRYMTEKEALTGLVTALIMGELDEAEDRGRKRSFVASLILSTSPFIAVIEKSDKCMKLLLQTFDHASIGDEDDALCHSVARILTSLIESKHAETAIHEYVQRNKEDVVPLFFNMIDNDAMLFIYLELIGACEEKRTAQLVTHCQEFNIMNKLLNMLGTCTKDTLIKNLLEAIVTISSCFSGNAPELSALIERPSIDCILNTLIQKEQKPNTAVCRLAALTHLIILEADCVAPAVAANLTSIRALLRVAPGAYCEKRSHEVFTQPVGCVRIAAIELLVAFIDKSRDPKQEPNIPPLIEEVMAFFFQHTESDFIGIEIVQLVRRVLASKMSKRIQGGLLSHTSLTYMLGALRGVSNLWELGHLRCIVQDVLTECDNNESLDAHVRSFAQWKPLQEMLLRIKDAKFDSTGLKRRRGAQSENGCEQDGFLPICPFSPLAAPDGVHKTFDSSGAVVHEDTPRKVMYVTAAGARVQPKPDTPGMPNFGKETKVEVEAEEDTDDVTRSLF